MNDPILPSVHSLLSLFTTELADVKFPDMDAEILARATDEVRAAADMVARAEASLEVARAALADRQEALLARAQRALAYARVYAEEDPRLAPRIESIALPRARRAKPEAEGDARVNEPPPPRRRGRPAKNRDGASSLFESAPPPAPMD